MTKLAMVYPAKDTIHTGEILLYSPLALGYLATHTPDNYEIELYDEFAGDVFDADKVDADLVAIAAITPTINRSNDIGDRLKKRGIKSIIGGAHVTALPDEALQHFDSVCMGEGEAPWREFIKDFESGKTKDKYFGPMNVSLDNLGVPRRDMCHENYQFQSILTSRGCPYSCSFCYLTVFENRKYRTIPHEYILEDFEKLKNKSAVIIVDENFIGYSDEDREDRKILLEKIIKNNYNLIWGCQVTTTIAEDAELMSMMYKAGCRAVYIGFEAIDEDSLKIVRKNHNIGLNYKEIVSRLHKHKIAVIASTIFGLDSHDKAYPDKLIKALKESKADFPRVFFATAWPGTPFFEGLAKEDRVNRNWDDVRKEYPSIKYKHFTKEEALETRKRILGTFFNTKGMIKIILRWLFKDRSLMRLFIKMNIDYKIRDYKKNKIEKAERKRIGKDKVAVQDKAVVEKAS